MLNGKMNIDKLWKFDSLHTAEVEEVAVEVQSCYNILSKTVNSQKDIQYKGKHVFKSCKESIYVTCIVIYFQYIPHIVVHSNHSL